MICGVRGRVGIRPRLSDTGDQRCNGDPHVSRAQSFQRGRALTQRPEPRAAARGVLARTEQAGSQSNDREGVGSAVRIFPFCPGADYDNDRSMPLWGHSLGKLGTPDRYARVLVQGLPIYRRRRRNGQRLLPHRVLHGDRPDARLCKCRGQWQQSASAILPIVRDAALQRGRGASSSDLRPCRHFR